MENIISKIISGSIAEEMEIEPEDKLISINDTEVKDIIDYKFLIADEYIKVDIEKKSGEVWELEIEKEYDEDLGIEFKNSILDKAKNCRNKCVFCFVDQLPKGMRETLYFKDDDSRLSFLQGNFVTLTNMTDDDIERIIRYRISPINVSVHSTNPKLREELLNNRFAGNIYERLKKLASAQIILNCQIVLCPGLNDGEEFIRTIEDLYKLYPSIRNVAVVPVGITKYRENLYPLKLFTRETARKQIEITNKLQEKYKSEIGELFVRLSDEFYVVGGIDVPEQPFYGDYDQLEDGVGMIRNFRENIVSSINGLSDSKRGSFTLVTGELAYDEINKAANIITNKSPNIKVNVCKVKNDFFGHTITVAGLLTGRDIIKYLRQKEDVGEYIILSDNMFKRGYEPGDNSKKIMLDDTTVVDLERELQKKVLICDFSGEDLVSIINYYSKEE